MSVKQDVATWEPSTILMAVFIALTTLAAVVITLGVHAWALVTGVEASWNPFTLVFGLIDGSLDPSGQVAWWIGGVGVFLLVLVVAVVLLVGRRKSGKARRGDEAAQWAGRGRDIEPITERAVAAKAERLGVEGARGFPVGRTVAGDVAVLSSFEDVCITIAGPRTGKTTSWVVPRIFAAPGAVVATSNKRDIVDETRARREQTTGEYAWVFDPQNLAGTTQSWWWNPLSYVTDYVQAGALADMFLSAEDASNKDGNDMWDRWSCQLIAPMLLAAAKSGRPITALHEWLSDQTNDEAVLVLRALASETKDEYLKEDFKKAATSLEGFMGMPVETRGSVYGGAVRIMHFLNNTRLMRWVTPSEELPEFKPEDFVRTHETLYCLSQEGRGSATQIVTPLTVAVVEAATAYATTQAGGRLKTPMLIELDEAANVCRWNELPNQYSHFGSRGLCVDTVLQSWSQGERVWGEKGMKALWSAANLKVYGGGVSEPEFLRNVSELIGVHWVDSTQVSSSSSGRSYSTSKASQQRPIATVSDLQALPQGRAWVFASGAVATLVRLIPFWEQPSLETK
ncbi:MAG: TraM recognition domain-containing protein [Actinomycetaceae bacterium]|nr:TraM recognition domain-containing protein [Actinomycetaceae bacterium]